MITIDNTLNVGDLAYRISSNGLTIDFHPWTVEDIRPQVGDARLTRPAAVTVLPLADLRPERWYDALDEEDHNTTADLIESSAYQALKRYGKWLTTFTDHSQKGSFVDALEWDMGAVVRTEVLADLQVGLMLHGPVATLARARYYLNGDGSRSSHEVLKLQLGAANEFLTDWASTLTADPALRSWLKSL